MPSQIGSEDGVADAEDLLEPKVSDMVEILEVELRISSDAK